jgi:hypothetical protein
MEKRSGALRKYRGEDLRPQMVQMNNLIPRGTKGENQNERWRKSEKTETDATSPTTNEAALQRDIIGRIGR